MADSIQVTIDGRSIEVTEGTTVMDAAEQAGIHIPNLCHLKGFKGIGACRLCLVEVAGLKRPMAACTTRTRDGMVIATENETIRKHRRYVIDLLLSMHPMDCMTCPKAGVCRLQEYAYDLGLKGSSFSRKDFNFPADGDNPFIVRDPNYCVLCSRCVRVCKAQGTSVLDFFGRGVGSRVTTAADLPLQDSGCTFCGSCVEVCPVNAIIEVPPPGKRRGREWEYTRRPSICLSCADACSTWVSVRRGRVERVTAGGDAGSTGYICAYGRFDFDGIDAETRLRTPLQRVDGEFRAVTWEDALNVFTEVCGNAGTVATVTSGNLFNEDLLTLRRLSEAAGFQEPCSTVVMYGDAFTLIGKEVDIDAADLIVLVGLAPSQWERVFPALDVKLRRLVRRGTPLVVVNAKDTRIAEVAQVSLPGEEVQSLRALIEALDKDPAASEQPGEDRIAADEAVCRAAELYAQAEQPVILTLAAFSQLSHELASKKGDVVTLPFEANGKGTVLMGITGVPEVGADRAVDGPEVLYALGDFNIARPENVGFLVVQATHLTGLAREADLVLPVPTPYESHGTIVDYTESLRVLAPVIAPHAESRSHREILQAIGERLGLDIAVADTEDVLEQIHTFRAEKSSLRPPESRRFHCDPRNSLFGLDGPTRYSPRLSRLRDLQHPETVAQAV